MKRELKRLDVLGRKAYIPTDTEKANILASLDAESIDNFGFYEAVVADTRLDRHQDVLSKSFLDAMATKYKEGRAVVHGHKETTPCGYTFDANVNQASGAPEHYELTVKFYIPSDTLLVSGSNAKNALDNGIIRRVSVSFMAKGAYSYIDEESTHPLSSVIDSGFYYWEMKDYSDPNKFDVFELSLVTMGAQAAAVIKDLEKGSNDKNDTLQKNKQSTNTEMKYKIKSLSTEVEVNEESKVAIQLLETEADKVKGLEDELAKYKQVEADAKKELVTEFVNLKVKAFKNLNLDADKETAKAEKLNTIELKEEITFLKDMKIPHKPIDPNPITEKGGGAWD